MHSIVLQMNFDWCTILGMIYIFDCLLRFFFSFSFSFHSIVFHALRYKALGNYDRIVCMWYFEFMFL